MDEAQALSSLSLFFLCSPHLHIPRHPCILRCSQTNLFLLLFKWKFPILLILRCLEIVLTFSSRAKLAPPVLACSFWTTFLCLHTIARFGRKVVRRHLPRPRERPNKLEQKQNHLPPRPAPRRQIFSLFRICCPYSPQTRPTRRARTNTQQRTNFKSERAFPGQTAPAITISTPLVPQVVLSSVHEFSHSD